MAKVTHIKDGPHDVWAGEGSEWRLSGCATFKAYHDAVLADDTLRAKLPGLIGKTLGCLCNKQPCMAQWLARIVREANPNRAVEEHRRRTKQLQSLARDLGKADRAAWKARLKQKKARHRLAKETETARKILLKEIQGFFAGTELAEGAIHAVRVDSGPAPSHPCGNAIGAELTVLYTTNDKIRIVDTVKQRALKRNKDALSYLVENKKATRRAIARAIGTNHGSPVGDGVFSARVVLYVGLGGDKDTFSVKAREFNESRGENVIDEHNYYNMTII